jgi:hypothetical protein
MNVQAMPLDQRLPASKRPPLRCDCRLHVFGDARTYPYRADKRNTPRRCRWLID